MVAMHLTGLLVTCAIAVLTQANGKDTNADALTRRVEQLEQQIVYLIENVNSLNKKEDKDIKDIQENKDTLEILKKDMFLSLNVVYMGRVKVTRSDDSVRQDFVPSGLECILFCKKVRKEKGSEYNVAMHYGGYNTKYKPQDVFPPYCECLKNGQHDLPQERFASFKFA